MNSASGIHSPFSGRVCPAHWPTANQRSRPRAGQARPLNDPRVSHLAGVFSLVTLLTLAALPAHAQPPLAVPVDGQAFAAELVAADAKRQLTLSTGQGPRVLPAAELVRWGTCAECVRGPVVVLADGGLLVADVLGTEKERLKLDSDLFGLLELPLGQLAGVVFDPPAQRLRRDLLLDRLARATGESDQLLLSNGDELSGLIEAVERDRVRLGTNEGPVEIERSRMAAVVFNPLLRRGPVREGLWTWVGLADGSRLIATGLLIEGSSLQLTTAGGQTWKTTTKEIVCLQPLGGRVVYLSELKAADYHQEPFLNLRWPTYGIDRNVTGGLLRCGGRLYLKGLGVHSFTRLTYRLTEPYKRFEAELGIDDSTAGGGSVRFEVRVDGRQKYISQTTVRGGMPPVAIRVDLDGAKQLELIVDYADRADELDHADWLDARLVR